MSLISRVFWLCYLDYYFQYFIYLLVFERGTSTSNFMLFCYGFISSLFILINSGFIFFFTIVVMLFSYFFVCYSLLWSLISTISRSGQPRDLKMLVFLSFLTWIFVKKIFHALLHSLHIDLQLFDFCLL